MSVKEKLQAIIDSLTEAMTDAAKHEKGNSAAATRLRKDLQAAVHACRDLRQDIQDERHAKK